LDGDDIHVVTHDIVDGQIRWHLFDTVADTWTTIDTMVHDPGTDPDLFMMSACVYVQTDGDIVVVGTREQDPDMGQQWNVVAFWRSTNGGTSFGTAIDIDGVADTHFGGCMILGVGNRVHVFYSSSAVSDLSAAAHAHHKTIRDDNSLSSRTDLSDTGFNFISSYGPGVHYDDGGTERCRVPFRPVTTTTVTILEFDDGDSPTIVENTGASDNTVIGGAQPCMALAVDVKKVFLLYGAVTGLDLYSDENDDDAGWGTDVLEENTTVMQQVWANVFDNGGLVLAWVDEESDDLWYNEKSIAAAGGSVGRGLLDSQKLQRVRLVA
jgi:hypothetical protein